MADREPLRVGPLVLRWVPRDHQWQYRLVGGRALAITGFIDKLGEREIASARLLEQLERSGYLAQYRSRRRLLARECERRSRDGHQLANSWKLHALNHPRGSDADTRCMARHDFHRARAAKYARWANQLKDSP